jgi:aminoglycoside 6-adenylyltransferase
MLLTSSRAVPDAPIDVFSDYDVVLALTDVQSFHKDNYWLEHFGPVLAVYWDPIETEDGYLKSANVTQYESGLRIDFTLWSVELLQRVAAAPQLPPEFDAGYRVLLDKDDLTRLLKPATYRGYLPTPPTDVEYQTLIESFFLDAIAVATLLWRDDVLAAKHVLDHVMKHEQLRPLLEWHIEIENQWRIKLGPYGRRLKQWLRPDLWNELANTYTDMTIAANWKALFLTLSLYFVR